MVGYRANANCRIPYSLAIQLLAPFKKYGQLVTENNFRVIRPAHKVPTTTWSSENPLT
ncbi:MAG: hypothetical protein CM1200mP38_7610 [Dehalococcoidia bacterium]|nr:MAG: hypothetical protein CM1200mP38_7610 [Dehalococcoidia bacterium]